jgi:glutamate N-acetyltransferase/amino-acid N-acetyltransferase
MADALAMTRVAADVLGIPEEMVLVASTGVIGVPLEMHKLIPGIRSLRPSREGGAKVPRAMMTTDKVEKVVAIQWDWRGCVYTLAGVAKGAGMIHPNMATMLAFFTCDAPVEPAFLASALKAAVDDTFNMISIDGDTSTNDTVFVLANGMAGGERLGPESQSEGNAHFQAALRLAALELAKAIVRDGEGATHLMEVEVRGARSQQDARMAARAVVRSNLVKAALFGADPNWGRIMAALGYSGAYFEPNRVDVYIGSAMVASAGKSAAFDRQAVSEAMRGPEVKITIDLNDGPASAVAWGCDLSPEYVLENSQYTT